MTKTVRIENADSSNNKIDIEVWDNTNGEPRLLDINKLNNPFELFSNYITSTRYLVIRERRKSKGV
jgi:hypothetical protein